MEEKLRTGMGDIAEVTGMVISSMPVGEYDRRIVLITKERGKISAFAKGARRPGSALMGITRPFVFGTFQMYEGRTSYNLKQAFIDNYFENVITDLDSVCYAYYFAEIAEYYARENLDASAMINLLYISLKALENKSIPDRLVRCIYELKIIEINGECPQVEELALIPAKRINDSTLYTLQYILSSPLEKLYKFTVSDEVLSELIVIINVLCNQTFDKHMKSEKMLP